MYAHLLCTHVDAHTHVPAYRSQKRNQVLTLSLLFSWDKFLIEPRDKFHQALAMLLFLPPPIWCYRNDHCDDWLRCVDTGDLNLGLQAWTASTLIHWALLSAIYISISFLPPELHIEAHFAPSCSLQLNTIIPTLHSQQSQFDSGSWTVWMMLYLPRLPDPLSLWLKLHMQWKESPVMLIVA